MPQYLTAAHSVCRKNYIVDKNGVAGAEPPYRSSAICATESCSGFVWLTTSILAWTRGGSPTLSPGKDAGRVCPKALHDAEPTKHTQPFTTGKGFGVRDREFVLSYKKTVFSTSCMCHSIPLRHIFYMYFTQKNEKLLLIEKKCTIILTIAQKAHKKQRNIKEVFL